MTPAQLELAIEAATNIQRRLIEARMLWSVPSGGRKIHDARVLLEGLAINLDRKIEGEPEDFTLRAASLSDERIGA